MDKPPHKQDSLLLAPKVVFTNTRRNNLGTNIVRKSHNVPNTQLQSQHTTQRIVRSDSQLSGSEYEDDIQVMWSRLSGQAHPAQRLITLVREELVPGEAALLNIVRGNNSKKDPEKVCVFCSKTFISRENRLKHTEKCHKDRVPFRTFCWDISHLFGRKLINYYSILLEGYFCPEFSTFFHED